jgi:hypothetical protein
LQPKKNASWWKAFRTSKFIYGADISQTRKTATRKTGFETGTRKVGYSLKPAA